MTVNEVRLKNGDVWIRVPGREVDHMYGKEYDVFVHPKYWFDGIVIAIPKEDVRNNRTRAIREAIEEGLWYADALDYEPSWLKKRRRK